VVSANTAAQLDVFMFRKPWTGVTEPSDHPRHRGDGPPAQDPGQDRSGLPHQSLDPVPVAIAVAWNPPPNACSSRTALTSR